MAADKPSKRRRKTAGSQPTELMLREWRHPRSERRYEPRTSSATVLTMLGGSIAAVLLGAGLFGQWLRGEAGPHPYAAYLLAGGVALLIAVALFGQWGARPIRVGDAGVAVEKGPGEIERMAWRDITGLLLSGDQLTLKGSGGAIAISVRAHPEAAARVLAEARARIPARVEGVQDDALPKPNDSAGRVIDLEPPQVAGLRCKATDRPITFERDARLCGRCGEVYHKDGAPKRCLTCEAQLLA